MNGELTVFVGPAEVAAVSVDSAGFSGLDHRRGRRSYRARRGFRCSTRAGKARAGRRRSCLGINAEALRGWCENVCRSFVR